MDQSSEQNNPSPQTRILVVEDDLLLREVYGETLTNEGFYVETAVDGEEGMKKMQEGGWDLVLLDIILPKIDGIEIMKKLKLNPPKQPNKTVLFLTNLDKDEEIKTALQYGEGYLIKSQVTPGDLVNEVKVYLAKN